MGKTLIVIGLVLVAAGVALTFGERFGLDRFGLGRLPGDISFERGNTRFYFPLATSIVLSVIASFVMWLMRR